MSSLFVKRSTQNIDEIVVVLMDCLAKPFSQAALKLEKHIELVESLLINGDTSFAARMRVHNDTFSMLSLYNANDHHYDRSEFL